MKKQSFLVGAFLLASGGFLAKIIGAFYKIPLTNILGTTGLGIYYLIFPFYSLMLVLCSSGISTAVTKMVAGEREKRHKLNEITILKMGIVASFILSLVFSILMIFLSRQISTFQGNANAFMGYIAVAPALVCASIIAIIRAYFQGVENMIPTTLSMILEQAIKLIIGLIFSSMFMSYGLQFAVFGAILGVTISELIALLLIIIHFIYYRKFKNLGFLFKKEKRNIFNSKLKIKKKYGLNKFILKKYELPNENCENFNSFNKRKRRLKIRKHIKQHVKKYKIFYQSFYFRKKLSNKEALKQILKYALPTTLCSVIMPLNSFIDSFIIINLLITGGVSTITATSLYGLNNGVVATLIGLPVLVIVAISTAMMPNLSGLIVRGRESEIAVKTTFFIKIAWIISLPMFIMFLILAPEVIKILFGTGLNDRVIDEFQFAYKLLMIASVEIIYYAFLQTFTAILQAINKPIVPFLALFFGMIARIVIIFYIVPINSINIFGVTISNVVFLTIATSICLKYILKKLTLNFSFKNFFIKPTIAAVITAIITYLIKLTLLNISTILCAGIAGMVGLILYLFLIFALKTFNNKELQFFPRINIRKLFKKYKN